MTPLARRPAEVPASVHATVERARAVLADRRASVNYGWLRRLSGASSERVANALAELEDLLPVETELRRAHVDGGRPHYAQFRAPFELYALVRLLRPDHIIETGVSSGVSSAHFLLGVRRNRHGKLHSIDLPLVQRGPRFSRGESPVTIPLGRSSGWAIPAPLKAGWDLRLGESELLLPPLVDEVGSVGIFLHDSLHTPRHLSFELSTVRPKLPHGAVVLADNTVWTGAAFPRFAKAVGARVRRRGRSDLVGLVMP